MRVFPLFIGCLAAALCASAGLSASHLTGQFSGRTQAGLRLVDMRVRFFEHPRGGEVLDEQYFHKVAVVQGRFSVPLKTTELIVGPAARLLYVDISIRPAGRRYARYMPAGPRRILSLEMPMWMAFRVPEAGAHAAPVGEDSLGRRAEIVRKTSTGGR